VSKLDERDGPLIFVDPGVNNNGVHYRKVRLLTVMHEMSLSSSRTAHLGRETTSFLEREAVAVIHQIW